ncbi:GNAT family N-acetyltransferase [Mucilaginibacter mali]|uniref:GNAT family N-acetyltransferase n=1 Tax=Mucilaginibacter mali TaxID=2740462 RepID=A0A7D4UAB2_9SPHI|nr:GNAT family N-acetyltransferase [Mucilaginibacter mali]QKJ29798.1 GNAT family N-acetyltransferase [Mucilaginibacter mali]
MKAFIKNTVNSAARYLSAFGRPSKRENMRLMNKRGDMPDDFVIREATIDDIKLLAKLHVQTWNETYWNVKRKPTLETRLSQWEEKFNEPAANHFCFLVINPQKDLIGFAYGKRYAHDDLPAYRGELNKLYLLSAYHHLGLGRKLVTKVAERFLSMGIDNMVLFGTPRNPSCHFHEVMGGRRLYAANGEFHGGYAWDDLMVIIDR